MLKINDRVKCIKRVDGNNSVVNEIGTIKEVRLGWGDSEYNCVYCVEFDNYINGNNIPITLGSGISEMRTMGHWWNCREKDLELVERTKRKIKVSGIVAFTERYYK